MDEQAAAGWYPDGQGNERFWDGSSWTEQLRQPGEAVKKEGAFSRLGSAVKRAATDKIAAKEVLRQKLAQDALAAGALVTSGVFGTSTVEIYEEAYVRVASWPTGVGASTPAPIMKDTPYEKLRAIKFTPPSQDKASGSNSALEGAVGPAVASLIKGGKGLLNASGPGLAAAGIAHIAGTEGRTSYLTITTDQHVHTLTNKTGKTLIGSTNRGHNDVGIALEEAGRSVLPSKGVATNEAASPPEAVTPAIPSAGSTLAERMPELSSLHQDGILSDDEFSSAKAKLLDSL